ncbi:hypothetical protein BdWA1_003307 [Babesia duncani]|uniref:Rad60/SUMO-like domain-containing protein n=1 Tax=Babesia duncani TaxID=323732 RepID=A0AAD9PIQ8_9APIC|nr:hypothetical protein BdWA1_003307 [Babesia duncani]
MEDIFSEDIRDTNRFRIDLSDDENSESVVTTPVRTRKSQIHTSGTRGDADKINSDTSKRESFLRRGLCNDHDSTRDIIKEINKFFEDSETSISIKYNESKPSNNRTARSISKNPKQKDKVDDNPLNKSGSNSKNRRSRRIISQKNTSEKNVLSCSNEETRYSLRRSTRSTKTRFIPDHKDDDQVIKTKRYGLRKPKKKLSSNESLKNTTDPIGKNESSSVICLRCVVVNQYGNVIKDNRLEKVYIRREECLGALATKFGDLFGLAPELHGKVKFLIDGDIQRHSVLVGDELLGLEDGMQVDIMFPQNQVSPTTIPDQGMDQYINSSINVGLNVSSPQPHEAPITIDLD